MNRIIGMIIPDVKATIRKEKGRTRLSQLKKHTIPIPIPNAIDTVILAHLPTLPYQFLKWKKAAIGLQEGKT